LAAVILPPLCFCRLGNTQYIGRGLYLKGFHEAHAAARVDVDPALVTEIELNADGGYAATRKLMTLQQRPEALIITGLRETAFADPPLIDLLEHRPPIEQIGICYSTRLIVRESTRSQSGVRPRPGRQKNRQPELQQQ
jgi:DNA-binding LacI/PurR family transcriptional regulator